MNHHSEDLHSSEDRSGLRIGMVLERDRVIAVAANQDDEIVARSNIASVGSLAQDLLAALSIANGSPIVAVMIASDHFRRALADEGDLARVGVLRVGAPSTTLVPSLSDLPANLVRRLAPVQSIVPGAISQSGMRLVDLDEQAVALSLTAWRGRIDALAISGVFSNLDPVDELRAAEIARVMLGDSVSITLSHKLSGFGLLERENAAIVDAALAIVYSQLRAAVHNALASIGSAADLFFVQSDGTLVSDSPRGSVRSAPPAVLLLDGPFAAAVRGVAIESPGTDLLVAVNGNDALDKSSLRCGVWKDADVLVAPGPRKIGGVRMNLELPVGSTKSGLTRDQALAEVRRHSPEAVTADASEFSAAIGAVSAPVRVMAWTVTGLAIDSAQRMRRSEAALFTEAIEAGADPSQIALSVDREMDLDHTIAGGKRITLSAAGPPLVRKLAVALE